MVERKQIALIYTYNDNWIGGTYYILNIIKSLNYLDDVLKPFLTIIHDDDSSIQVIKGLDYPHISFIKVRLKFNLFEKVSNKLSMIIFKKRLIRLNLGKAFKNVYPVSDEISTAKLQHFYYWIPDFQEHYLPHFFSKKEIALRIIQQKTIVSSSVPVVFSSNNALEDFNKFYEGNRNKKKILRFVSILSDEYKQVNLDKLLIKYNISEPYFIVPNQFWRHKNHILVLEAIKLLKNSGHKFNLVFTGKEYDHRNPDHVRNLKSFTVDNNLTNEIKFLGFIDRNDQLQLMKNSIAIIQPSLFEGWSTVVEDTKALNHFILLSDIPLHREQIADNCIFFDPHSAISLFDAMQQALLSIKIADNNYNMRIVEFANNFVSIFK